MNQERLETLLWEFRDGTISAEELAELERHVELHPEAREFQKEIETMAERLGDLARALPPRSLRPRITRALADLPIPSPHTRSGAPSPRPDVTTRRPISWLPIAASLLVGATVGYLLQPGTGASVDTSRVAGTMNTHPVQTVTGPTEIDLGGGAGAVMWRQRGNSAVIDIQVAADTDLEIDLEVPEGYLLVRHLEPVDSTGLEVISTAGRTIVRTRGPVSRTLEMGATADTSRVRLIVRAGGSFVAEEWLSLDLEGERG